MGIQESGASTASALHQAGWQCSCKAAAWFLMVRVACQHQVICVGSTALQHGSLRTEPSKQQCRCGGCGYTCMHASVHACMHACMHACSSCCPDASARRPHSTASGQAQCHAPAHHPLVQRRWPLLAAVDYVSRPRLGLASSLPLPQVMVAGGRDQGPLWAASMSSPRGGAACKPEAPEDGTPNSHSLWFNQRDQK